MYDFFPFSGVGFFIISFSFILFLHIFKNILSKFISYKMVIFIAVVVYISFAIPEKGKKSYIKTPHIQIQQ
jgi:membrane protein involved in D-alanine export